MTKVLLVCNIYDDKWIGSLVRSLKCDDKNLQIDLFNTAIGKQSSLPFYTNLCSHVMVGKRNFPFFFYKVPKLGGLLAWIDICIEFHRFACRLKQDREKYDVLNVHFLLPTLCYCLNDMKIISRKILLSPWGSDILRVKRRDLKKLQFLARQADFVSCDREQERFRRDIIRLLHVSEEKLINIGFGTEMIDFIAAHAETTREVAKEKLGLSGKYVIVCGYNAHKAQNHIQMIEAIASRKEQLPENLLLLLPMTYGKNEKYMDDVEQLMKETRLNYRILRDYLSNEELLYVRKCADMFIHAQDTDANSGSLAEYLLCKTKVVNAEWLSYPNREKYGRPYYVFNSFNELGDVVVRAYKDEVSIVDERLVKDIQQDGWSYVGKQWVDFYNSCTRE